MVEKSVRHRRSPRLYSAAVQYNLGKSYRDGIKIDQDFQKAIKWFKKAAKQGHVKAQYSLGLYYLERAKIPSDYDEAFVWFKKAAKQDHVKAQYYVGFYYQEELDRTDLSKKQRQRKILKWYQKSAAQGCSKAQQQLISYYERGVFVKEIKDNSLNGAQSSIIPVLTESDNLVIIPSYLMPIGNLVQSVAENPNIVIPSYLMPIGNLTQSVTGNSNIVIPSYLMPIGNLTQSVAGNSNTVIPTYLMPIGNLTQSVAGNSNIVIPTYLMPIGNVTQCVIEASNIVIPTEITALFSKEQSVTKPVVIEPVMTDLIKHESHAPVIIPSYVTTQYLKLKEDVFFVSEAEQLALKLNNDAFLSLFEQVEDDNLD